MTTTPATGRKRWGESRNGWRVVFSREIRRVWGVMSPQKKLCKWSWKTYFQNTKAHHVRMVLTHSGVTNLPAHTEQKQKVVTGLKRMQLICGQRCINTTHLITESVLKTAVWKFPWTLSISAANREKGSLTNRLSLCFHSDLCVACARAFDSQMPGKTRLARKMPELCRKPVITAIIQLDLICIIKLCYCLAVGGIASPCSYQLDSHHDGGQGGGWRSYWTEPTSGCDWLI